MFGSGKKKGSKPGTPLDDAMFGGDDIARTKPASSAPKSLEEVRELAIASANAERNANELGRAAAASDLRAWLDAIERATKRGDTHIYFLYHQNRDLMTFNVEKASELAPLFDAEEFCTKNYLWHVKYAEELEKMLGAPFRVKFDIGSTMDSLSIYWSTP